MDEARSVIRRLRRVDELERANAPAHIILAEVRALLAEAELWLLAEPEADLRAVAALARCRQALRKGRVPVHAS